MPDDPSPVQDTSRGALLTLHVQPNARKTEYVGLHGHALKVKVASPPTDGAANVELCRFLSARFGVPLKAVELQSGAGARRKRILIAGITSRDVHRIFPA